MPFKSIYISGITNSSPIGIELKRNLQAGGVVVTTKRETAEVVMNVLSEKKGRKILSLNAQGRAREYELKYLVQFRVLDAAGNIALAPTTVTQRSKFNYTESEALARVNEQRALYHDMESELVQQILRCLGAIKLNKAG